MIAAFALATPLGIALGRALASLSTSAGAASVSALASGDVRYTISGRTSASLIRRKAFRYLSLCGLYGGHPSGDGATRARWPQAAHALHRLWRYVTAGRVGLSCLSWRTLLVWVAVLDCFDKTLPGLSQGCSRGQPSFAALTAVHSPPGGTSTSDSRMPHCVRGANSQLLLGIHFTSLSLCLHLLVHKQGNVQPYQSSTLSSTSCSPPRWRCARCLPWRLLVVSVPGEHRFQQANSCQQ